MQEYFTVDLDAVELTQGQVISKPELARRLSEAIIDVVEQYKTEGYDLLSMDFNTGRVTIHFKISTEQ